MSKNILGLNKMSRILLLLTIVAISDVVASDSEPILVVRGTNPWQMVIGSDSATFAIYEDGSIIYQAAKPTADRPFLRRMVDDPTKTAEKLLGFDPAKVSADYVLSSATDQMSTTIWTPERQITIYGNWRKPLSIGAGYNSSTKAINERERKMWNTLPKEVRVFLARIEKEREMEGEPWLPENIEVMFWPYEYAPDESIIWPAEWPDLSSKTTRNRGEHFYSVFLPNKNYSKLLNFISTRKEKGAVLITEKKMAISYRFPFPNERRWMQWLQQER